MPSMNRLAANLLLRLAGGPDFRAALPDEPSPGFSLVNVEILS